MPQSDPTGILLVDKPGAMTSHDVVARARKLLGTRKVGHAGTLDPMATGLLILGVGAATRLLTFIVGLDKTYTATIVLGTRTDSDDADGEVIAHTDPATVAATVAAIDDDDILAAIAPLTGDISQVPSTVSAIKVGGRRAYDLARAGEDVELAARAVTVSRFDVLATRRFPDTIELDVVVECTSGTYIRALARDLGAALGVGGHLRVLRRTRIGGFDVTDALAHPDGITPSALVPAARVAASVLGAFGVTDDEARDLRQGKRLPDAAARLSGARAAAITESGELVGIVERRGKDVKSTMNLPHDAAASAEGNRTGAKAPA